mgnify:CR=1 FL=1
MERGHTEYERYIYPRRGGYVVKFKIEDLIVPTLIEYDYPERNSGETLFVLPFRNPEKAFNEIKKRLEVLKNPVLFLIQGKPWNRFMRILFV